MLALDGHELTKRYSLDEWPWTWVRMVSYVKTIKNIMQRAAMDEKPEEAMPPRWLWFQHDRVEQWFEERRKARESNG